MTAADRFSSAAARRARDIDLDVARRRRRTARAPGAPGLIRPVRMY